jgi:riboflavin kinase/FMN adenylyltransferase
MRWPRLHRKAAQGGAPTRNEALAPGAVLAYAVTVFCGHDSMRILSTPLPLALEQRQVALAAGFFDGVHRGHRSVLEATFRHARKTGVQAWALTFEPHPLAILRPEQRPPLLTPTEFRLERLADAGLDGCLLMPFTPQLGRMTPQAFVDRVLAFDGWNPRAVFAGDNWRFGAGGAGTVRDLPALSRGTITAIVVPPLLEDGEVVSSTRIRTAIQQGDIATATRLLGRPYRIRARVVPGRGIGRKLGIATANLKPDAEVLPPHGIYALWAGFEGRTFSAVADFGTRPTFDVAAGAHPVLEVHVLDLNADLYGRELDVAFVARLREERRFPTPAALVAQIHADIAAARRLLTAPPPGLFPKPHRYPVPEYPP